MLLMLVAILTGILSKLSSDRNPILARQLENASASVTDFAVSSATTEAARVDTGCRRWIKHYRKTGPMKVKVPMVFLRKDGGMRSR